MTALDLALFSFALALFAWLLTRWIERPTFKQALGWALLMTGSAWALIGSALIKLGVI